MVNKERYVGLGMDQDTAPDKRQSDSYYDALNIQILNNGRTLSITNVLSGSTWGTGFYRGPNAMKIAGAISFQESIYVFTTNNAYSTPDPASWDYIFKIDSAGNQTEVANGHWNLSYNNRITGLINYETDSVIKMYWLDGYNPLRVIKLGTVYGTITTNAIDILPDVALGTPTATFYPGSGSLIAGSIQYCYNFYKLNGVQSALSPTSNVVSISNCYDGWDSGENTGGRVTVTIPYIDENYDAVRIYSIHWTEYEQTPKISIIYDGVGEPTGTLTVIDDGIPITTIGLSDLLAIDPIPYVAQTLATKRERLFLGNLKNTEFNPDIDCRAYSYPSGGTSTYLTDGGVSDVYTQATLEAGTFDPEHDCINSDYDTYKYRAGTTTYGGTGMNFYYSFDESQTAQGCGNPYLLETIPNKSLKKFEIYRIGIVMINAKGQRSPVHWMADIKVPDYASNKIVGLGVYVTSAGSTRLSNAGVTQFQVAIVERKPQDRTIISQGFIVPGSTYKNGSTWHPDLAGCYIPYYTVKHLASVDANAYGTGIRYNYQNGIDWDSGSDWDPERNDNIQFFTSSDTIFDRETPLPTSIRILGVAWVDIAKNALPDYDNEGNRLYMFHRDEVYTDSDASADTSQTVWGDIGTQTPRHLMDRSYWTLSNGFIDVSSVFSNKIYINSAYRARASSGQYIQNCNALYLDSGNQGTVNGTPVRNAFNLWRVITDDATYKGTNGICTFASSIVLSLSTDWHNNGSGAYDRFDVNNFYGMAGGAGSYIGIPIVELLQSPSQQYGGNTYEDKQRNEYLSFSTLQSIAWAAQTVVYIGDVWVGNLMIQRADGTDRKYDADMCIYEYVNIPYIEHNVNVYARSDNMKQYLLRWFWDRDMRYYRLQDNNKLLNAYNQLPDVFTYYPTPLGYVASKEYPLTVIGSNAKAPGELLDSWLQFNPLNTKQLEGQYGPITKLHNLKGDILAIQQTGIAFLEIEPRVQTTDSDGVALQVGIGSLFYNHKYLTTNSGTSLPYKLTIVDNGEDLFYYNDSINVICNLVDGKLSTLKSIKTLMDANKGLLTESVYINKSDQIWFNFATSGFFLVYDLLLKKFITKRTAASVNSILISTTSKVFDIWRAGADNGTIDVLTNGNPLASYIQYLFNPSPTYEKVFHNLEYRLRGNDFTAVQVDGPELSLSSGSVTPTIENKFDIHRMYLPRIQNSRERWRGIYIFVKLSNTGSFSLDDMVLMYNIKG